MTAGIDRHEGRQSLADAGVAGLALHGAESLDVLDPAERAGTSAPLQADEGVDTTS